MKALATIVFSLLFSASAWGAAGTLTGPHDCSAGPWTESPDGNVSVSAAGAFGGGIVQVYRLAADGVTPRAVPNAFWGADDGGSLAFGGGEKVCMGMLANPLPVNPSVNWEITPMYTRDPQSNQLQYRY